MHNACTLHEPSKPRKLRSRIKYDLKAEHSTRNKNSKQSQKIINNLHVNEKINIEPEEREVTHDQEKRKDGSEKNNQTTEQDKASSSQGVVPRTERRRKETIKGTDIGLTIYTTKSEGWPAGTLTKHQLIKGMEERKYKYTFRDEMTDDEEIFNMINSNSIDLTDCFETIEEKNQIWCNEGKNAAQLRKTT